MKVSEADRVLGSFEADAEVVAHHPPELIRWPRCFPFPRVAPICRPTGGHRATPDSAPMTSSSSKPVARYGDLAAWDAARRR